MARYAGVLPDPGRALNQLFTYHIPEHLAAAVQPGTQVLVPFGPRSLVGLVLTVSDEVDRTDLKDIEAVLEGAPPLSEDALPVAKQIAAHYLCDLGEAIRPFLPQGMSYRLSRRIQRTELEPPANLRDSADAARVLEACRGKRGASLGALRRLLPTARLTRVLQALKEAGTISEHVTVLAPEGEKKVRLVGLAASPEECQVYCQQQARRAPGRVKCLQVAQQAGPLPSTELAKRAEVSLSVVQGLVKQDLLAYRWSSVRRVPWMSEVIASTAPVLTEAQTKAVAAITDAVSHASAETFLLYGVTASGKTEVFLHAISECLRAGQQAIVLMPEISLTAQAVALYRARFGDRVALLHSALSPGERWDEWQRVLSGEAAVVIGARSALFAPIRHLGLIVIDEEHETSYKQEQAPRYHARTVARWRAAHYSCPVVLASATPSLESFYAAEAGDYRLLRLPERVEARPLPSIRVIDLRGAARQPAIFSSPLRQGIALRLADREQVILFLNRRGYASVLLCPTCGHSVRCPDCGVSLTFYQQDSSVRCHHCGLATRAPDLCGHCGGRQFSFSGFGTERVESELARLFPQSRAGGSTEIPRPPKTRTSRSSATSAPPIPTCSSVRRWWQRVLTSPA